MKKLLAFFLFIQITCLAQYKQGLQFYEHYQFAKAIPCLKNAADKANVHQKEATLLLANSYSKIEDFKNAELYYQKAIALGNTDADIYYEYGNALKINNNYDEALKQYTIYLQKKPNNDKAKNAVTSFQQIKLWQSLPKEYEIKNVEKINTKKSEFSPFVFNGKFYYTSWQKPDLVNYEGFDYDNTPFLNVYYCDLKNDTLSGKNKTFSKNINGLYHDGPIFFSKQNELYLTRVNYIKHVKDTSFVNRPQLYVAQKNAKGWSKLQAFAYNNPSYSLAHACVSNDGTLLFFSSDMPGGVGGSDIWMCKKNASGTWDKPINLGADINTSGKEEFPFIRKDGMLFFSSDGLPGFGGLDVFSAKQIAGKWILNRNEGVGINSPADDFGVFFTDDKKGYISSNRDGGKGKDDIYAFTFTKKLIFVDGTVLTAQNTSSTAKNLKVVLEDSKGNKLLDTRTNQSGYFRFENLSPDNKYMVKLDETDGEFSQFKRYYFMDSDGQVMRVTVVNEKGEKFVFKNLPVDASSLPQLDSPDDITLAGNLLYGENPSKPIANKKIVLKDENGNILDEVTTNAFGAFVFNKIPSDGKRYLIELVTEDDDIYTGAKIILTNKNGKEVSVIQSGEKGKFAFNILASDKTILQSLSAEDVDLLIDIEGSVLNPDMKPLQKIKIYLKNEKGVIKDSILTDEKGYFYFRKLFGGENYLVSIDENDPNLIGINKIYITDKTGKTVQELVRNRLKGFGFSVLKSDRSTLKEVYVDDPWLEVLSMDANTAKSEKKEEITIIENVYYALNAYKFDEAGQRIMDKVVQIMQAKPEITIEISSHTDSQGDDKTNLLLSQKRAKYAVDYMIAKGIDKKRLKAVGYGESKLINKCANNIPCTEEEHAKNRRTEFKIEESK